jgi:hypothetical protein
MSGNGAVKRGYARLIIGASATRLKIMIEPQKKIYRMPVQASGSNVFVNLPVEVRNLYGIKKGDMLVLVVDPTSATPLVISDIEKASPL